MSIQIDLTEKVILITGGYGYLGSAIAENMLAHGGSVIVLGRNKEKFIDAFQENKSDNLYFEQADISELSSIKSAFSKCEAKFGKIDVLINNAFYLSGNSPTEMTDYDFMHGLEGTLSTVHMCTREIIKIFKKQGYGNIINLASMYGMVAPEFSVYDESPHYTNPPHYGAAKAGVIQLTKYYASYLGKEKIRVNSVAPGPFPSEKVQKDKTFIKNLSEKTCLNRIGKPEELGGIFTFLCSDASSYITGQNFAVDGGWTIK